MRCHHGGQGAQGLVQRGGRSHSRIVSLGTTRVKSRRQIAKRQSGTNPEGTSTGKRFMGRRFTESRGPSAFITTSRPRANGDSGFLVRGQNSQSPRSARTSPQLKKGRENYLGETGGSRHPRPRVLQRHQRHATKDAGRSQDVRSSAVNERRCSLASARQEERRSHVGRLGGGKIRSRS